MRSRRVVGISVALAVVLAAFAVRVVRSASDEASPRGQTDAGGAVGDSGSPPATLARGTGSSSSRRTDTAASEAPNPPPDSGAGRELIVRVKHEKGESAEGLHVAAIAPGFGTGRVVGVTDAEGKVRLRVPWQGGGRVVIERGGGDSVASVEISSGESEGGGEVVLQPCLSRRLQVWVRRAGIPSLPQPFRLAIDGRPVDLREVQPKAGFVTGFYAPSPATTLSVLSFEAEGVAPVSVTMPPDDGLQSVDVFLDLDPAGTPLDVSIASPRDLDAIPALERWKGDAGPFEFERLLDRLLLQAPRSPADGVRRLRLDGLPVGRYRLVDWHFLATSEPVDLLARGSPATLRLDLSTAGTVRGSIDVPPGFDADAAEVWIWDGIGTSGSCIGHGSAGGSRGFDVGVPGNRPITLQARHPLLSPDPRTGTVTVTEPQAGLRLRLERGNTATGRLLRPDDAPFPPDSRVLVSVIGKAPNWTTTTQWAPVVEGRVRLGGSPAGTFTLVFDHAPDAPLVQKGVALGDGETDLGDLRLEAGFTIRLHARTTRSAPVPPRLTATAGWLGGPTVGSMRWAHQDPKTGGLVLEGLAAGRYRVRFFSTGEPLPPATGLEQVVDVGPGIDAEATVNFDPGPLDRASEAPR